jgi:hypothetical protein
MDFLQNGFKIAFLAFKLLFVPVECGNVVF